MFGAIEERFLRSVRPPVRRSERVQKSGRTSVGMTVRIRALGLSTGRVRRCLDCKGPGKQMHRLGRYKDEWRLLTRYRCLRPIWWYSAGS